MSRLQKYLLNLVKSVRKILPEHFAAGQIQAGIYGKPYLFFKSPIQLCLNLFFVKTKQKNSFILLQVFMDPHTNLYMTKKVFENIRKDTMKISIAD